ncbi:unnamed protein product, partial [Brenthis ino]
MDGITDDGPRINTRYIYQNLAKAVQECRINKGQVRRGAAVAVARWCGGGSRSAAWRKAAEHQSLRSLQIIPSVEQRFCPFSHINNQK